VFVVGHLGDWRRAAAVLLERESLCGHPPPRREAGESVAPCFTPGAHPGSYNGQDAYSGGLIANTIDAHMGSGGPDDNSAQANHLVAHSLRADGFDAGEDGTGRGTPLVPVAFDTTQITSKGNYSRPQPGDPCHPLAAGAHAPAVAFNWQSGGSKAMVGGTNPHTDALSSSQIPAVRHAMTVRRLTPGECEALQGFPRNYTAVPYRGKPAADGPRYRALGNSMAVNVMRWIGERIALMEEAS
jgi:DNA (cytosine-5)-methyltransferase 1